MKNDKPSQNTQEKVAIYCRVSTKEQVKEGNSLVSQEKNCYEYAIKHNLHIARVFTEEGESAKTANRPELKKLLDYCSIKKNQIKAVIVYKIDRLARNIDDYSQIRLFLKRHGVEIKSTSENFEDNPAGRFMENIIANVAQFDNDVRAERCIGGMRDAASEGRYVWRAPMGYKNTRVDGKATILPSSVAPLVKKAFELIAEGRMRIEEVRKLTIGEGLVNSSGRPPSKSQFYLIFDNPVYTGLIVKFGQRKPGTFPPLVSPTLFNLVQQQLHRRTKRTALYQIENPDFPLRRFISSPSGENLTGCWSQGRNKKYPYYRFINGKKLFRKEFLERKFIKYLSSFSISKEDYMDVYSRYFKALTEEQKNQKQSTELIEKEIDKLKASHWDIYEKNQKGIISDSSMTQLQNQIDSKIYELEKKLSSKPSQKHINPAEVNGLLLAFVKDPGTVWEVAPPEEKLCLQWFEFPFGVTFDGHKFQTAKMCSLFKLKELIQANNSCLVNLKNLSSNNSETANSLACFGDKSELNNLWTQIVADISEITKKLNTKP